MVAPQPRPRRSVMPMVLYFGLWLTVPYFSTDLLTYAAYGSIASLPGGNPYAQAADTIQTTTFGHQLAALGWHGSPAPTPYGPIWTALSTAAVRLGEDAVGAVWIVKGIAVTAVLATAVAGWWMLGAADPRYRLTGTLAVLWNPALALLLAAEGHNDAVVMFLVVLSLALTVRQSVVGAWLAQIAAILTKYFSVVLLPLQLTFWWRTRSNHRQLVAQTGCRPRTWCMPRRGHVRARSGSASIPSLALAHSEAARAGKSRP